MKLPEKVILREVVVRDGIQPEEFFLPTQTKVYLINQLADIGFRYIEVTSFVHPLYVPQFKDAEEVLKQIKRKEGVSYNVLTLNEKALDRVLNTVEQGFGPDMVLYALATSEAYNKRNVGKTSPEMWGEVKRIVKRAHEAGLKVIGTISTVFGCPLTGFIPPEKGIEFAERFLELDVDELNIADTTGEGTPREVYEFFCRLLERKPEVSISAHFHEPRGWGLANVFAALQAGVEFFDVSMGGIGGQPATIVDRVPVRGTGPKYLPTPFTGNVRGEDLVVMLEGMGIETGIDVEKYLELGRMLEKILGRQLKSFSTKAGRITKITKKFEEV
ncbi:MAG TPA: hydroxymethylglutaryl-CoA lyase [Thermococcus sp.]|nr:hydroxymethylglutaryl-CoA lyase [Thermococcus sp.]